MIVCAQVERGNRLKQAARRSETDRPYRASDDVGAQLQELPLCIGHRDLEFSLNTRGPHHDRQGEAYVRHTVQALLEGADRYGSMRVAGHRLQAAESIR